MAFPPPANPSNGVWRNGSRKTYAAPRLPARQHRLEDAPCPPHLRNLRAAQHGLRLTS